MSGPATRPTGEDVAGFLAAVAPPSRAEEARRLDAIFREVTGFAPTIWGGGMVGYGRYDYIYASGRSGSWFATGFAPRKANLVVYIMPGYQDFGAILSDLGPHRLGKSCLYLGALDKIDEAVLGRLIRAGLDDLATRWPVRPS